MEIEQIHQKNQIQEDSLLQKFTQLQTIHEEQTSHIKRDNYETISSMEAKCLELIKERDFAMEERESIQNELQRALTDSQMKDCRISNLNEMIASKETVIGKLGGENSQIGKRLESMAQER